MSNRKFAFAMIDLVVAINICVISFCCWLPNLNSSRESARRMQCSNNLKQIALASLNHESANIRYPSGGWTSEYVGDPDRGFGKGQPGSWAYSLLPYMEQNALYQLGGDGGASNISDRLKSGAALACQTPLTVFFCPSRRSPGLYTVSRDSYKNSNLITGGQAKSDYAANFGSTLMKNEAENLDYSTSVSKIIIPKTPSGVIYDCSETRVGEIRDGMANTYLIGEKFVYTDKYETAGEGDQICAYAGLDGDVTNSNFRSAGDVTISVKYGEPALTGTAYLPRQDCVSTAPGSESAYLGFGGPHKKGFTMSMCDGSVQVIPYDIDAAVHACLSNRRDGAAAKIPD